MKNLLRLFAEWVTELKLNNGIWDIFASARAKIAFFYFFSGVVILIAAGVISDSYIAFFIHKALLKQFTNQATAETITSQILGKMMLIIWLIRFGMVVVMAAIAYIIAGVTLRPIRRVVNSQRRFIANASHELRTPLANIKTNSEVTFLKKDKLTKEEIIERMRSNMEEVGRMRNVIQVLLSFSSYENRIDPLIFSRIDLKSVITKTVGHFEDDAGRKNIKISFTNSDISPILINGNAVALEELISNLLRNAITYTPPGGFVHIKATKETEKMVLLSVQDSGCGIPPEDLPHIFEPFYRGVNSVIENKTGSAGLGLAIVAEITKLHHAHIEAKSGLKIGTTFLIRFPAA